MCETIALAMLLTQLEDEDPEAPQRSYDLAKSREHRGVSRSFTPFFASVVKMLQRRDVSPPSDNDEYEFLKCFWLHPL